MELALFIAYLGPAFAPLLGAIGSSIGTQMAASAGLTVLAEDPGQRTRVLLFSALPMTQTFYGFIFMLQAFNVMAHITSIDLGKAAAILSASIGVGLAEFFSAWMQGKVCRTTVSLLIKTRGAVTGMGIILAAYVELFGILAMVFGILVLGFIAA